MGNIQEPSKKYLDNVPSADEIWTKKQRFRRKAPAGQTLLRRRKRSIGPQKDRITPVTHPEGTCRGIEPLKYESSSDAPVTTDSGVVSDIDDPVGRDSDRRSLDSRLVTISCFGDTEVGMPKQAESLKRRTYSLLDVQQISSERCPQAADQLSHIPSYLSYSRELISSQDKGSVDFDSLILLSKQASRYLQLRENYNVLHLLVHGSREQELRRKQYESYATVSPLINTLDSHSEESNAVMVQMEDKQTLFFILEHFIKISVHRNKHLETLFVVFNVHGHSDGTLELCENKPRVHMHDIIKFVQECRTEQKAVDVSNTVELHLVFGQCYAHSFDLHFASQCDKITDIWWFTSEQFPKTINLHSEMDRLEHSELMRFARSPWKQNSLRALQQQLELKRSKEEVKQLRDVVDRESLVRRYSICPERPGYLLLVSNMCFTTPVRDAEGIHKDTDVLQKVFREFHYGIGLYENNTAQDMKNLFHDVATNDTFASFSCVVIAIMSHGGKDGIEGIDRTHVTERKLIKILGTSTTLAGKPKLVLIQTCRGEKPSARIRPQTSLQEAGSSSDSSGSDDPDNDGAGRHAAGTDIIIARTTIDGHQAYRNTRNGSYFIQSFAEVAKQHGRTCDVDTILKMVTHRVMQNTPREEKPNVPSISHCTLIKRFYLA